MNRWIIFLGMSLLMGCAMPTFSSKADAVQVTLLDTDGTKDLQTNEVLKIRLPANPSTGYVWQYKETGDAVLGLENVGFYNDVNGLIGAAGDQVWTFRAQKSGIVELTYIYVRPWEPERVPAQRFKLTIQVRSDEITN